MSDVNFIESRNMQLGIDEVIFLEKLNNEIDEMIIRAEKYNNKHKGEPFICPECGAEHETISKGI